MLSTRLLRCHSRMQEAELLGCPKQGSSGESLGSAMPEKSMQAGTNLLCITALLFFQAWYTFGWMLNPFLSDLLKFYSIPISWNGSAFWRPFVTATPGQPSNPQWQNFEFLTAGRGRGIEPKHFSLWNLKIHQPQKRSSVFKASFKGSVLQSSLQSSCLFPVVSMQGRCFHPDTRRFWSKIGSSVV